MRFKEGDNVSFNNKIEGEGVASKLFKKNLLYQWLNATNRFCDNPLQAILISHVFDIKNWVFLTVQVSSLGIRISIEKTILYHQTFWWLTIKVQGKDCY